MVIREYEGGLDGMELVDMQEGNIIQDTDPFQHQLQNPNHMLDIGS